MPLDLLDVLNRLQANPLDQNTATTGGGDNSLLQDVAAARKMAQSPDIGVQVDARNRMARLHDRLYDAATAGEQAGQVKELTKGLDPSLAQGLSGTEAMNAKLSGGTYRDTSMLDAMLKYNRPKLRQELEAQAAKGNETAPAGPPSYAISKADGTPLPVNLADQSGPLNVGAVAPSASKGSFSVTSGTPSSDDKVRAARANDLLGILSGIDAKEAAGNKAGKLQQQMYAELNQYGARAPTEGVAPLVDEIMQRAAEDPAFARVAGPVISGLRSRGVSHMDAKFGRLFDPNTGTLGGGYLPLDERTVGVMRDAFNQGGPSVGPKPQQPGILQQIFGGLFGAQAAPPEEAAPAAPAPAATPAAPSMAAPNALPTAALLPPGPPGRGESETQMLLRELGMLQPQSSTDPLAAYAADTRR